MIDAAPDTARAVQEARLEFAFNGLPLAAAMSVILAVLTVLMLRRAASGPILFGWLACLAAVNGLRLIPCWHYRARRRGPDLAVHERMLVLGCLGAGAAWGSSALLFLPKTAELQFFLAFVIAGVASAAVTTLSVAPRAAYAFVIPCVLPLTLRFLLERDALHVVMGIMAGFYTALVMLVARRGHIQLTRLVASRLEVRSSKAALYSSELQRRENADRLRVATEAGQIGVWDWDLVTHEQTWDERMYRMYGVDHADSRPPQGIWRLRVLPADMARVEGEVARAIAGTGDFRTEFRILWPDGEERFIKSKAIIRRDDAGVAHRMTGISLDITELRRLERVKREFVSVVSHELRTPLTSIRGSLGLLMNGTHGVLPGASRDLLRVADRNAERLGALIDDLLDVEKLEAGRLHCDLQLQPLLPLVEQALESNAPLALGQQVKLEFSAEPVSVLVSVDGARIVQVLTNLLSNAVKFSPVGASVSVTLSQPVAERLRVTVRDRGPGIPAQFRARIFTQFSQFDASDSRQKGGTGVGLAISKALIGQMGGTIGFAPAEGGGAVFHFELPVRGSAA